MLELKELETQQVGLRMPKYLVNDVDDLIKDYNINRSTLINTAVEKFIKEQKEQKFYARFENSIAELKLVLDGKSSSKSLEDLIDELED